MVEDVALTARRRTLHLHHAALAVDGNDAPVACRSRPLHLSAVHQVSQVGHGAVVTLLRIGQDALQRAAAGQGDGLLGSAVAGQFRVLGDKFAGRLGRFHHRTAEGPSRAGGHVDVDAIERTLLLGILQHVKPLLAEEADVFRRIAFHAVDRCNLQRADARPGILLNVPLQVGLVNGRAQPPPAAASLGLVLHLRPCRLCGNIGHSGRQQYGDCHSP